MKKIDCRDREEGLNCDVAVEDEFGDLVIRAKEGDSDAAADVLDRLKPLLISSIRRYFNDYRQYDDLLQDGNLMVIECLNDFDPSKGVHFLGYIKSKLRFMYLNKHKIRVHSSLNKTIGEGSVEILDLLVSEESHILQVLVDDEDLNLLNAAMDVLTKRQREVIELHYIEAINMVDIAVLLGVSYRTVINTKVVSLDKLKREILRKKYIPL